MRQAGILAAAGLIALLEMPARLPEDHANARLLASALARHPLIDIDLGSVETNIVIFSLREGGDAAGLLRDLRQQGVLGSTIGPHSVRLVTHFDVSRADCVEAAEIVLNRIEAGAVALSNAP